MGLFWQQNNQIAIVQNLSIFNTIARGRPGAASFAAKKQENTGRNRHRRNQLRAPLCVKHFTLT
jgi:hypothetical protein